MSRPVPDHARASLAAVALIASLAATLAAAPTVAATIDPGLAAELAAKGDAARADVLMLFDAVPDFAVLEARLIGASPSARCEAVIAALKACADASQAEARRIAADAVRDGHAEDVRVLWLANGLALRGDAAAVQALAATKGLATLVHDRPYDLLSAVTAAPASAVSPDALRPIAAATDTAWGVKWVKADRVWRETGYTGAGVIVGHFDTGVWLTHSDLVNRLWVNSGEIAGNGRDDDGNGYADDVHGYDFADRDSDPNDDVLGTGGGHGTHTAGTVAGDGSGGVATGVAPGAVIMACKVIRSDGTGAPFSAIYEAQQYALAEGARVLTMSLGVGGSLPLALRMTERRKGEGLRAAGVVLFCAAGNDYLNSDPSFAPPNQLSVSARVPAPWHAAGVRWSSRGGVVTVGGSGYQDYSGYASSSRGPALWSEVPPWYDWPAPAGLVKPDIVAPALDVNSLRKPSGYSGDSWSGTSMATPHAAGVAALMLGKNPGLSPAEVDSILEVTAMPLGISGKDNTFGSGLIDALAAVNAVPTGSAPYLVCAGLAWQDAGGDGVIDPDESFSLSVTLQNNSPVTSAAGVTAELAVAANPYVTVTGAAASYTDIALGGGIGHAAAPFALAVGAGAPQGFLFTCKLTISAAGGYRHTEDFKLAVGLPEFRDHDAGRVYLTVTDQGSLGYLDDSRGLGNGFGPRDGSSLLYLGSFWGGTDAGYVCNRDYAGVGGSGTPETYEWRAATVPNGRVAAVASSVAPQAYRAVFDDSGHASPRNVQVTQRSYAWSDAVNDQSVVIEYTIRNNGTTTLTDYHAGVFCDWDVGTSSANYGGTDDARGLVYMYEEVAGPYVGIALLYPRTARNLTLINNSGYVYPGRAISDQNKWFLLVGALSLPSAPGAADYSALASAGPFTLAPGQEDTVAFTLVYGDDLASLRENVGRARLMYPAPGDDTPPATGLALEQNRPNPFNPLTLIRYSLEREGPVTVTVFDLAGRKLRTIEQGVRPPGGHALIWDGTDDAGNRMPSGSYLYRLQADGRELVRKMMLVR